MEFDRSRVYSAVNADELKPGDKVIVRDTLAGLKEAVSNDEPAEELEKINGEGLKARFFMADCSWCLAYLVERKENCTNCIHYTEVCLDCLKGKDHKCYKYKLETKTEQKAEKHYRPFRDTDELIKVWNAKIGTPNWGTDGDLTMPNICVASRNVHEYVPWRFIIIGFGWKDVNKDGKRITKPTVYIADEELTLEQLFCQYTFLDGSPCGVEE